MYPYSGADYCMLLFCFDGIQPFYFEYIIVISHPTTFVVPHLLRLPQDYGGIKLSPQILTYDAEDGLTLMRMSHSTILLKFGSKVPLQKLRNRSLS